MKPLSHVDSLQLSDRGIFYGYRWFAWVLAGVSLTLPGRSNDHLGMLALLVIAALVVTVALTAGATLYLRQAQRYPLLLAVDIGLGISLLLLSNSNWLPFMPYALSSLILPALFFGHRGALIAGSSFVILNQSLRMMFPADVAWDMSQMGLQVVVPLGFAFAWSSFAWWRSINAPPRPQALGARALPTLTAPTDLRQPGDPIVRRNAPPPVSLTQLAPSQDVPQPQPSTLAGMLPSIEISPLRRQIYDVHIDPKFGLSGALQQLAHWLETHSSVQVQLNSPGSYTDLAQSHYYVLLRTAQEAVLNIHQHAQAHRVQLSLQREPRAVTLIVQDDGVGLLDGTYERPGIHGLRMVRYRIAELDGQLMVFEGEQGGVTVRATLPLESDP